MKPVDGQKVKETVEADGAVTKMLYRCFVSVLTQERGCFAWGFVCLFVLGWGVGRQDSRSANEKRSGGFSGQEIFTQEFRSVWHGKSVWRANRALFRCKDKGLVRVS